MKNLLIYTTILISLVLVFAFVLSSEEEEVLGEDERIEQRSIENPYELEMSN